jgi:hypothetical protein
VIFLVSGDDKALPLKAVLEGNDEPEQLPAQLIRPSHGRFGTAWDYFPHDHARSRAYRWNDDGLAGICDRHQRICFAIALWNGRDPILKERLFGLINREGNHGEDVKAYYFYLDNTPTHWERYTGLDGTILGMHSFGLSAPMKLAAQHFGFDADHVVAAAKAQLARQRSKP